MRKLIILISAILVAMCVITSCTKDNFELDRLSNEVTYAGSFALPLAYSNVAFYQIIDRLDTTVSLRDNSDGYLSLFYESYVESKPVQDLLTIGDVTYDNSIDLSELISRGTRAVHTISYETTENISFTLLNDGVSTDEAEIDSMVIKSATLDFYLNANFGVTTRIRLEFPTITKNGVALKDSATFMASDANPNSHLLFNLDGYKIDLTKTARRYNELPINISIRLEYSDGDMPTSGQAGIGLAFRDFRYKRIHGYFGHNNLFFQSDTIDIKVFKDQEKYTFERVFFNDPKLQLRYWNTYGVPSRFYFTKLETHLNTEDRIVDITSSNPNFPLSATNPFNLATSTHYGDEIDDSVKLDKYNSNLDQIVPARPSWIHFLANAETNPDVPSHNNFILDESVLRAKINMELPLWGYLYNFKYIDTLNVDLSDLARNYPISRFAILLTLENSMPIEAFAQFYLVDDNFNILDSLVDNDKSMVLEAAPIDANGKILKQVETQTRIEFTKSQIEKLPRCTNILMQLRCNTQNALQGKLMKIYRNYGFKANIAADIDFDVDGNIDSYMDKSAKSPKGINLKPKSKK